MEPASTTSREFYDDMWNAYGHLDAVSPAAFHRRRVVCQLADKYGFGSSEILDVGCGMGELLRDLEAVLPRARISGADISERSLVKSRELNPRYTLFPMDLVGDDFEKKHADKLGTYDLVTCSEVLEHIPNAQLAAERLASLVKKDGYVIITVPGGAKSKFDIHIGHQRHYRPDEAAMLLRAAGLGIVEQLAWGFPFHNLYRTAVRVASQFAVSDKPQPAQQPKQQSLVSGLLGNAYTLFGRALNPLFYLNLNQGGEQTVVVARR